MEEKFNMSILFKCGKELALPVTIDETECLQVMSEFKNSKSDFFEILLGEKSNPFGIFNKFEILGLTFEKRK